MNKTVEITIRKDGSITVDAKGFQGQSCEEATAFIDQLFQKQSVDYKPSYFITENNHIVDPIPSGFCG